MQTPLDPLVADMVLMLNENHRETFEERAAIITFCGGRPRAHAECLALLDVLLRHPDVLTGVTVLQVDKDGNMRHALTTRPAGSGRRTGNIAATPLAALIAQHYGGTALLAPSE